MEYQDLLVQVSRISNLNSIEDAAAVVTHVLKNSTKTDIPFCSASLRKKIIHEFKKKRVSNKPKYTFVDLFAGIGGFHQALERENCRCIFACEWDEYAKQTYYANYGLVPFGDIRKINEKDIPAHDILCAGFPCQPFSIAGVSKKNSMGRATGFEDKTQGTLFFDVVRIIKAKRPSVVFLENVKNLLSHDRGNTWKIIYETLLELNYQVFYQVVDGKEWVPQHRERLFVVCFNRDKYKTNLDFEIPTKPQEGYEYVSLDKIILNYEDKSLALTQGTWEALKKHKEKHEEKGNGFGYKLLPYPISDSTITATISARYYKDGAEILVPQGPNLLPRKLSVAEAMQLQGYDPNTFVFPVPKAYAYKQIGNSVVVPAIQSTAHAFISLMKENE